jgi:hypothetical protein
MPIKLPEVVKEYIQKYKDLNPQDLAKKINMKGIGAKKIEKYIKELNQETPTSNIDVAPIIKELSPPPIDISELAGRHERGGVLVMTEVLSENLDEIAKTKKEVYDYRGKVARIKKDKPIPKGIKIDD